MAYTQLEELTSRRREKVAIFLTAEHMAAVLAIGLPVYAATLGMVFWVRVAALVLATILGIVVASEVNGMAAYERVVWWCRGRIRRAVVGATLRPLEFMATATLQQGRAIPLDRTIRRRSSQHTATVRLPSPDADATTDIMRDTKVERAVAALHEAS